MDRRVKSIEHVVAVFLSTGHGHKEKDLQKPTEQLESEPLTIFPPGTGNGEESVHCSLPGNYDDVYNTYRFIYHNKTVLSSITKRFKGFSNIATIVNKEHSIIFTIDRHVYYEVRVYVCIE